GEVAHAAEQLFAQAPPPSTRMNRYTEGKLSRRRPRVAAGVGMADNVTVCIDRYEVAFDPIGGKGASPLLDISHGPWVRIAGCGQRRCAHIVVGHSIRPKGKRLVVHRWEPPAVGACNAG